MNLSKARSIAALCAIAATLSAMAVGAASAAEENTLEAIVVTAQRRAEPIEKVPQAVQAISGTELTREGVTNLAQTIALIPSATTGATIGPGMTSFQIRGVTTGETDGDPTVGYYLDNFAFSMPGRPYAPVADFYDMQRVEVLRGPSGTLYGLGSLGGTIKVITNDPVLNKYEASVRLTGGRTANANGDYSGDLMFNLPLVSDRVALRGVVSYKHTSGYAYIIPSNQPNGNPVDDWTARMKLLAKVTDDFSVTLGYWHNTTHPKYSDRITYADNPAYGGPAVDQTFGEAPTKFDIGTLDASYDFGFATLQSTTGYLHNVVISNNGGFIPGIGNFTSLWPLDTKNFNEDLRLVSNGSGALRYIAGLFYQDGNTAGGQNVSLPDYSLGPGISGFATLNDNRLDSKSWAIYGEGTYTTLNGLLDVTLGGRFYDEKRKFTQNSAFVIYAPTGNISTPTIGVNDAKHNTFNPRINIAVHPADNGMVFVEAAKGFRSGAITSSAIIAGANAVLGTNLSNSSPPDTLWNYELGTKWTFLDKALSLEVIGYFFNWKDAQLELSPTLQSIVVPAGNVRGHGVDVSIDWRVFDTGLELKATGNLNTTLLKDVPVEISTGLPQISNDAQLPGTAKASGTFAASYVHALGGTGYELRLNSRYSARATQQSIFTGGAYAPYVGLASVRAGIGNQKMEFAVFSDNLTDARGPLDRPGGQVQIPYPRVIGLSFEMKL